MAHADAPQVRRLIRALDDVPVFLHCDAKTPDEEFRAMLSGAADRVAVVPRRPTNLASWSLVDAELAALRAALEQTDAAHIAVLSGADYPVVSTAALRAELARVDGETLLWNTPLPFRFWDTPRYRDGGLWRLRFRFLLRGDQVVFVRGLPLRWPVPRRLPADVELRGGSAWKVYARRHAAALLRVVDSRPDLVRFWRTTLVPEESFVPSVLASAALTGEQALAPSAASRWYMEWSGAAEHPHWLTEAHFERLVAAREPVPVEATTSSPGLTFSERPTQVLFARKFSSGQSRLLDRIDEELRS
jgi:hypothetical protein